MEKTPLNLLVQVFELLLHHQEIFDVRESLTLLDQAMKLLENTND